jgi:hypothetical protein
MTRVSPSGRGRVPPSPVDGRIGHLVSTRARSAAGPGSPRTGRRGGPGPLGFRHYQWRFGQRLVTSRSMSGPANVCERRSDLCRLLTQVKCVTLKSQPRYFVQIVPGRVATCDGRHQEVGTPSNRGLRCLLIVSDRANRVWAGRGKGDTRGKH